MAAVQASGFMPDIETSVGAGDETKMEAPAPGFAPDVEPQGKLRSVQDYLDFFVAEMKHPTFVQSILAEWWATTLFLFFLILSVLPGGNDAGAEVFRIAIVAGLMIFSLVYCFYAVSGGNINPAVSLGLVLSGRMTLPRGIGYIAAQIVGAITGTAMAKAVSPAAFNLAKGGINALQTLKVGPDAVAIPVTADQAFLGEVFGTLLLVLAVLFCTDTARSMEHPHMTALIPLTIGLVVLIDHLALIPIDGCSVNPARSLGSAIVYGSYDNMWVFTVGPFVGAIFAAVVYKLIFGPVDAFNSYIHKATRPVSFIGRKA